MHDDTEGAVVKIKKRSKTAGNRRQVDSHEASPSVEDVLEEADSSVKVDDLLALRALRQAQRKSGIDLEKLHAGDERQRKKAKLLHEEEPVPQLGLRQMGGAGTAPEDDAGRSVIRTRDFTGQTNALDVDKHMVAYIEGELTKRKGGHFETAKQTTADPEEELYRIAERYKVKKDAAEEGNITLSSAMLTAIPEVDLGVEARLKNIEDTERAKRALFEATEAAKSHKPKDDGGWAAGRFFLPENRKQEVADIMALARAEAEQEERADEVPSVHIPHKSREGKKQVASDAKVASRFIERQREMERMARKGRSKT